MLKEKTKTLSNIVLQLLYTLLYATVIVFTFIFLLRIHIDDAFLFSFIFPVNRYLLLVVMEAERAWSYAMQLKQEANTEPRKRFHLLARLRKAAKHGEKLEKLCESQRVDAKTKLEAQVKKAVSCKYEYVECDVSSEEDWVVSILVSCSQCFGLKAEGLDSIAAKDLNLDLT